MVLDDDILCLLGSRYSVHGHVIRRVRSVKQIRK